MLSVPRAGRPGNPSEPAAKRTLLLLAKSRNVLEWRLMANNDRGRAKLAGGLANHRRIEMIRLLQTRGNLCVEEMAVECGVQVSTASEHARRLHEAGLIKKKAEGRKVRLFPTRRATTLLSTIDLLWDSPVD